MLLDNSGEISTMNTYQSLPEFNWVLMTRTLYKRDYQNKTEGKVQFSKLSELNRNSSDTGGALMKWLDVFDSSWGSPESCQAVIVSQTFVFGYWLDLEKLQDKLKSKLDHFLKSIFTDDMDCKHIEKIMSEKETFGLLFVDTKSMMKM